MLPALLALLAGIGLCFCCVSHYAPMIQADILGRTKSAFQAAGLNPGAISVDGRDVLLRGYKGLPEISPDAQARALAVWGVRDPVRIEEIPLPAPVAPPPPPAAVTQVQTRIDEIIRLKNVEFLTASANLTPVGQATLNEVVAALAKAPHMQAAIAGHTDSQGLADANRALSVARAQSVKAYLTAKGIAAARMTAVGFGDTKPIAPNDTPEGRQRNRRIEFSVTAEGKAEVLPATR
ncbi:MAG: OmpA family protein [Acidobacteria bacterium]|nr:OmpA family protein [Acidobacteriota bacterium]